MDILYIVIHPVDFTKMISTKPLIIHIYQHGKYEIMETPYLPAGTETEFCVFSSSVCINFVRKNPLIKKIKMFFEPCLN